MYTCTLYTCTLVHLYTCTLVHLYTCTLVHLYTCTLVHLYTCTLVLLYTCTQHYCIVVRSFSSEEEIDYHMCHMSTSWSGDLVSCQYTSDLRISNILYATQVKFINHIMLIILFLYAIQWVDMRNLIHFQLRGSLLSLR